MWYEILAPSAIIVAALAVPGMGLYWGHYLVVGNHFRRNVDDRINRLHYQRDVRLSGHAYVVNGLDKLPPLPDK